MIETDMHRRFGGIARLYGQQGLKNFHDARVAIVGIGGVGSWAVEALARSGLGAMQLYDLDHIAESNVNRQLPAIDGEFGRAKVDAMAARVRLINPQCRVETCEAFIDMDNTSLLTDEVFNFVIDCIDNFRVKAAMISQCRRHKIPIITLGGAGGQQDPTRVRVADLSRTEQDPLLSKTRKLLRKEFGFSSNPKRRFAVPAVFSMEQQVYPTSEGGVCLDKPGTVEGSLNCGGYGSAMTVTATFAMAAVSYVLGRLADKRA